MMRRRRIHIIGAPGAGVTTLGRALASALAVPHHDTDDYYWKPSDPPYREVRNVADRLRLMGEIFLGGADWVLSGSLAGWGDPVIPFLDLVVFVLVPPETRIRRLRERERRHFGVAAVAPGGWRHQETEEFIEWATHYEDESREGRNLALHRAWLGRLPCPIIRLDGSAPTQALVDQLIAKLPAIISDTR